MTCAQSLCQYLASVSDIAAFECIAEVQNDFAAVAAQAAAAAAVRPAKESGS